MERSGNVSLGLAPDQVGVDADFSATPFKAKIANADCSIEPMARWGGAQRRHYITLILGGRDLETGAVSVPLHHGGPQGAKPKGEVVADILVSIRERRAVVPG